MGRSKGRKTHICKDDVLKRVIELFSTMTEAEEITEDSELIDDLEICSMDILFVISCLEEEFQVKISEKDVRKMYTVGDVANVVKALKK